ncbi:MAG: DegT/DnrJ/EryC1/StrS aminotransferase family protein [Armatimonadetes bacterium]|nr:DegT/DnrJ/EryC1/StrS aminotransferase family protein [Armatimonadota bacterium]
MNSAAETRVAITHPWPEFAPDEVEAAARVLSSGKVNYWTGEECRHFETEFAAYVGTRHAVAMMNGTVTLEALLRAIDLKPNDEVIVSPRSFMASASCVVTQGGVPVFADVDRHSGNLTAETIEAVLTPRTRAIILVHLGGYPVEMDPIMALAAKKGLYIIEDCAQAHGATYHGRPVGSIGHAGSFSFCQDKIMTTAGEGGMITLNDGEIWSKCWSLKDHGKSYDAVYNRPHPIGFRWLHESFGSNWRMTEIQGAIGRIQLRKLDDWKALRARNAAILNRRLRNLDILRIEEAPSYMEHANYKWYGYLNLSAMKPDWTRERILEEVVDLGVPFYSGSCSEIYLEKAFKDAGLGPKERLPIAKELGETSVMALVHPTLTVAEMESAADVIAEVLRKATK